MSVTSTAYNYSPDAPEYGACWEEIVHALNYRRTYAGQLVNDMVQIRDLYNGDMVTPMPDIKGEPDSKPIIPSLLNQAIDGLARRGGSLRPVIGYPALGHTDKQINAAEDAKRALYATWHYSGIYEVLLRRCFRHYGAYGSWCLNVIPDFADGRARVEVRDPLTTYPDLRVVDNLTQPVNVGFMYPRSRAWVIERFGVGGRTDPQTARNLMMALANSDRDSSDVFDVIEWVDKESLVIGVLGPRYQNYNTAYPQWPIGGFELRRWKNKAEHVPCSIPYRVTLDKIMGSVNLIIGMVNMMSRMTLLDYFAAEKAVWPDLVIYGKDGEPRLVGNRWKDGREGEPNIIEQGDVKFLQSAPGPLSNQTIDMLERSVRQTSDNPAMFGGEATGNIRSGQTVNQLGSYSIDPVTQELQDLAGRSLAVVNEGIIAVEKGYFGGKKQVFFSGWSSDGELVEFVPNETFLHSHNTVRYPLPGTDLSTLTVTSSQAVATGTISKHTGRVLSPLCDDPDAEYRKIIVERLEDTALGALQQQAMAGAMPAIDLSSIIRKVKDRTNLEDAIDSAHAEAQARQAAVPAPGPVGPDGQPGPAPENMPGLAMPGAGAEAVTPPPPAIGPAPASLENFKGVTRALRAR